MGIDSAGLQSPICTCRTSATTIVPKAIAEPTERSMPPEMMMSVAPMAAVATTVACSRMRRWLCHSMKSDPTEAAKSPQTKMSPIRGPSFVRIALACCEPAA